MLTFERINLAGSYALKYYQNDRDDVDRLSFLAGFTLEFSYAKKDVQAAIKL